MTGVVTEFSRVYWPGFSVLEGEIGDFCTIHAFVWIGKGAVVGHKCRIQAFVYIPDGVTIGNGVFIGPNVTFTNDKYPPSSREEWLPTVVEDVVSIGAGAVILPGVTIGRGATIGAGAVVTRDVPAGITVVGNPARPI